MATHFASPSFSEGVWEGEEDVATVVALKTADCFHG